MLNTKKKFNTVHNLITISIFFTNKNGMNRFNPLPPSKKRIKNTPSKVQRFFRANGQEPK